jgi:hypothetical protein
VREKLNLWRLHNVAEAYGKRPSEILNLETEIGAWSLDEACLMIGRRFEKELQEGKDPFSSITKVKGKKFSPAPKDEIVIMKIPESGIF